MTKRGEVNHSYIPEIWCIFAVFSFASYCGGGMIIEHLLSINIGYAQLIIVSIFYLAALHLPASVFTTVDRLVIEHFRRSDLKEEWYIFLVFLFALYCTGGSTIGFFNIIIEDTSLGSILFVVYLFSANLFSIPTKLIAYLGLGSLYSMIIFALLGYRNISENLAIFSFCLMGLNALMMLYSLRASKKNYD